MIVEWISRDEKSSIAGDAWTIQQDTSRPHTDQSRRTTTMLFFHPQAQHRRGTAGEFYPLRSREDRCVLLEKSRMGLALCQSRRRGRKKRASRSGGTRCWSLQDIPKYKGPGNSTPIPKPLPTNGGRPLRPPRIGEKVVGFPLADVTDCSC